MLAFQFISYHLTTRQLVTFVFLRNSCFIASVKFFQIAGCAIDQHCLRTDHPINLSFVKSDGPSAVPWFDPDRFPNLVYVTCLQVETVCGLHSSCVAHTGICHLLARARQCFIIFERHIIPVHGFRCQATWPHSYSLDSAVTPFCNAITFWDISTLVSHLYAIYFNNKKLAHYLSVFQLARCIQRRCILVLAWWPLHHDVPAGTTQWNMSAHNRSVSRMHCHCNGLRPYPANTSCFPLLFFPFPTRPELGKLIGSLHKFVWSI